MIGHIQTNRQTDNKQSTCAVFDNRKLEEKNYSDIFDLQNLLFKRLFWTTFVFEARGRKLLIIDTFFLAQISEHFLVNSDNQKNLE